MSILHVEIAELFFRTHRAVVKSPRGYAKSTHVSKDCPLYLICEHDNLKKMDNPPIYPHQSITIASNTGPLARRWLGAIRKEIETNEEIIAVYGDLRGPVWNQDHIVCRNGVEVRAVGRGYQQRGWRPTIFIGDDLDDDEEIRSDEQLEKAFQWWDGPVDGMLDETFCQAFVIGTPLDEICLLNYIADKETFEVFEFGAYLRDENGVMREEEGYETWPSKWPHERLQEKAKEIGRRAFAAEYLCQPQPSENPVFERHWFREYNSESKMFAEELDKGMYTVVAIDPAISKKDKADYSAIVTVSAAIIGGKLRMWVRKGGCKQGHWTKNRQVSESAQMIDRFYASGLCIETVAYQEALKEDIEDYKEREHRDFRVHEFKPGPQDSKERRAHNVAPLVERGCVYVDYTDPMIKHMVDQCVRFKPGQVNLKKDLMDAFVYCLTHIKRWEKKGQIKETHTTVLPKGTRMKNYAGGGY